MEQNDPESIPEWTKKIDNWGKSRWQKNDQPKDRTAKYIFAIIINILLLHVFNNLINWNASFVTGSYIACLWLFNLLLGSQIVANFLFLFYDGKWFKQLIEILLNLISIVFFYTLYIIFPFRLTQNSFEIALKIFFILAIVGSVIAIFVNLGKLIWEPSPKNH